MFDKLLIANRGEIACRIMRTARRLGIRTVAVYSEVDSASAHVALADEAVALGGFAPADSYLRGDLILAAARQAEAQAIHPGYGFLSENPEFAEEVDAAGLVFVGPSADAIRAMGLKGSAKAVMEKANVPVVPGYHGADQSDARLQSAAEEVGFPLLIKAVAGGGGKGMRRVNGRDAFDAALQSARSEALAAFGNGDVLIERYVSRPRHIEVQIFGDGRNVVHLFERDCSLQRRHQKVIEEAPAPGMTEDLRAAMGAAAVRAGEAIGYSGAGTVEFIVDSAQGLRDDGFFFMEMNTRLQVEHPVTEAITGVDLVEWQLLVAAGEPLPLSQDALSIRGHAFEARLYAEDVPAGFLPATGRLSHLKFPDGARADTGVRAGDDISPYYDPMIAKLIVHDTTRDAALVALRAALSGTEVAGSVTNLAFLGALAAHDGLARGDIDTGLIERDFDALTTVAAPEPRHWIAAAMAMLQLDRPGPQAGFTLWQPLVHQVTLLHRDSSQVLQFEVHGPDRQIWRFEDEQILAERKGDVWWIDGHVAPAVDCDQDRATVLDLYGLVFDHRDPLMREDVGGRDADVIDAPMPGVIRSLTAAVGQEVKKGDTLAVLEAMKMEHALRAPRDGEVAAVLARSGDQVKAGAALIRLEEVAS